MMVRKHHKKARQQQLLLQYLRGAGRAVPQPPRATRSQPESTWTVNLVQNPLFFRFLRLNLLLSESEKNARKTGLASNVAQDRAPPHPLTPWQSIQRALFVPPLLPSAKIVRLWDVHKHRTGWCFVGVPSRSTLQMV